MTTLNLELPAKLIPVFEGDAEVRGAYGGRGSAKTRSFAMMSAVRGAILASEGNSGQILCCREHLNSLDELQKKIQMEAMGIALGVGVVGGLTYSILDTTNLLGAHAEISVLVMIISITYAITIAVGQFRYK